MSEKDRRTLRSAISVMNNSNLIWCKSYSLLFLTFFLFSSCSVYPYPKAQKVEDVNQWYEWRSVASRVKAPAGSDWYSHYYLPCFRKWNKSDWDNLYWIRVELRKFSKSASNLEELGPIIKTNPAHFNDYKKTKTFKVLDLKLHNTKFKKYDALLSEYLVEDSNFGDDLIPFLAKKAIVQGKTFYVIHPYNNEYYVSIDYQQRYFPPKNSYNKEIDKEVQTFFDNFEFLDLKNG